MKVVIAVIRETLTLHRDSKNSYIAQELCTVVTVNVLNGF